MDAFCRVDLLGGLRVTVCGKPVARFRTRKTADLLAYLAYHLHQDHPRELLIELLWPECEVEAGRHSLSVALHSLRQQLEPPGLGQTDGVIVAERHSVRLSPEAVSTDVAEFEQALRCASAHSGGPSEDALATAVDLYAGELLPGFYDEWIFPEQQRLQELYFAAQRRLIGCLGQAGRWEEALQYALKAVRVDPLREEAHREVIRLYLLSGQAEQALRHYAELERLLRQGLEVEPSEETIALVRSARAPASRQATAHAGDRPASPAPPCGEPMAAGLLEPTGGAVPLASRFYVARPADRALAAAIDRRDSIVLIQGPRQVGKTSLLARGLQQARDAGMRTALIDLRTLNAAHLATADALLRALAESLCDQLDLTSPGDSFHPDRGASPSFRRYMRRQVLSSQSGPLLWALDGVDRIFACPFGSEVFGLFRSWHDERALDPEGPWAGLTLVMAYSTETHLFITDLNQSPFNVGTHVELADFTLDQVTDLNQRYGSPLRSPAETARFHNLVGGHPYLVCRGLHEMAEQGLPLAGFEAQAPAAQWIYGDHLRRISTLVQRDRGLAEALREVLAGRTCPGGEVFYRLRSAGVLAGQAASQARLRCRLYALHLGAAMA